MSLYNDKRISWLKRVFPEGTRICLEKVDKFHIVREGE